MTQYVVQDDFSGLIVGGESEGVYCSPSNSNESEQGVYCLLLMTSSWIDDKVSHGWVTLTYRTTIDVALLCSAAPFFSSNWPMKKRYFASTFRFAGEATLAGVCPSASGVLASQGLLSTHCWMGPSRASQVRNWKNADLSVIPRSMLPHTSGSGREGGVVDKGGKQGKGEKVWVGVLERQGRWLYYI